MNGLLGKIEIFKTALKRYGIWPTTVWEVNKQDPVRLALLKEIGDFADTRETPFTTYGKYGTKGRKGSVFDPMIAAWVLNLYAPESGVCFDPFAGGGTRAIMAAKKGLTYIGTELRRAEVQATRARCRRCDVGHLTTILHCDARHATSVVQPNSADFLITCPPYYNMEEYHGGPQDLSMAGTYEEFLYGMGEVINQCAIILKEGAIAVWVVGLHRGKDNELLPLNHDIARLHTQTGFFKLQEEIILAHSGNGALRRVGNFDRGDHLLVRMHEYALVFKRTKSTILGKGVHGRGNV
ncbi:MAG TPA: hypothetical protein PK822_08980 [Bacillota bacterium]|nr:hypothetical protein [Bacillota bacterium]